MLESILVIFAQHVLSNESEGVRTHEGDGHPAEAAEYSHREDLLGRGEEGEGGTPSVVLAPMLQRARPTPLLPSFMFETRWGTLSTAGGCSNEAVLTTKQLVRKGAAA